jgi:hypothetical protein
LDEIEDAVGLALGDNGGRITRVPVDGRGVLGDLLAMIDEDCHGNALQLVWNVSVAAPNGVILLLLR